MALPVNGSTHLIPAYYSLYQPRKDERLSWPSWLTYSGWLTHISGHPSAAGRAQDRESSPARDRRSTTVPRHQPCIATLLCETLMSENQQQSHSYGQKGGLCRSFSSAHKLHETTIFLVVTVQNIQRFYFFAVADSAINLS